MKIKGFEFWFGKHHYTQPSKTWIVVDTSRTKNYYSSLSTYEVCPADEFKTKEDALRHIEREVAPAHHEHTRLYEEIPLYDTRSTTKESEPQTETGAQTPPPPEVNNIIASDYKGKWFVLHDIDDVDVGYPAQHIDVSLGDWQKDCENMENCRYYGIPAYVGKDKELTEKIRQINEEMDLVETTPPSPNVV